MTFTEAHTQLAQIIALLEDNNLMHKGYRNNFRAVLNTLQTLSNGESNTAVGEFISALRSRNSA